MEQKKKNFSTSTVIITIIFLALFIILPPITRILYKEDVVDTTNNDYKDIVENVTMTCTKNYNNAKLSIVSVTSFTDGEITTNKITFTNQKNISESDIITDLFVQNDVTDYFQIFSSFTTLDEKYLEKNATTTTIEIDSKLVENLLDNSPILSHYQEKKLLETYYTDNGFICTE